MGLFGSKKTPEEILAEGRELYGDFNFAKALKVLDKASGTLDGEPDYLIALIYMYCRQDDSITRKHLRIAADAGYEEAAWLREILYKEHTFTAEELFENGNEAYKKKKYKDALGWWEKADARGSANASLQLGLLYENGQIVKQNTEKAMEYYLKSADMGNVTAQCLLGLRYTTGKDGIEQDQRKALEFFRRAAERGDDASQFYLGVRYILGDGGVKDPARGFEWLQKCIVQNGKAAANAKATLAKMGKTAVDLETAKQEGDSYYKQGVAASNKKDYATAIQLWEQAAARGNAKAYRALIRVYSDHNTLIPERMKFQDYEKAIAWDKQALEHGVDVLVWRNDEDEVAYGSYTIMYAEVLETILDVYRKLGRMDEAVAFAKECHQKGLDCEWRLMKLYLNMEEYEQAVFWAREHDKKMGGQSAEGTLRYIADELHFLALQAVEEEDYAEAKELAENAITLGSVDAMFLYGNLYEDGTGVEADKEQALYWYKKAAEKGLAIAQYFCGGMYCRGEGLDRPYAMTGLYWYEKAAEQGMAEAQYQCGVIYEKENAMRQNKSRALYWYKKAAEQGYAFGQVKCGDLYLDSNVTPVPAYCVEEARKYYEKAATQTEEPELQEYAQNQLKRLPRYN